MAIKYVGAEQEFKFSTDDMDRNDGPNQEFMKQLRNSEKHFYDGLNQDSRVWLDEGDCFYIDVFAFEGNSRLIEIKKGCAEELARSMMKHRARAAEYGGRTKIMTTHYNIGAGNTTGGRDEIAEMAMSSLGPVYKAILRNSSRRIKQGTWKYRTQRGGRIEFCTHSVMEPKQLEAGIAFLVGTVKGFERLLEEEANGDKRKAYSMLPCAAEPGQATPPEAKKNEDIDVLENGFGAMISTTAGKKRVGEMFKTYLEFFKPDIEKIATAEEMITLDKLSSGEMTLEAPARECVVDGKYIHASTGKSPKDIIREKSPLTGVSAIFSDAVNFADGKEICRGGLKRTTKAIDWGGIKFGLRDRSDGKYREIAVPREDLEGYMSLEAAAGDGKKLLEEAGERKWLV